METSWLIERLDNPALLQKGDEQRLRELIATYPYFSAPYLLLARSLHEQNHPAFEQLLPLISLQAFDRKRLFRLIHEETMDHRPWTIAEGEREAVPAAGAESEVEVKGEESTVNGRQSTEGEAENEMVRHAERSRSTTDEPEAHDVENEIVSHPEQANELSDIEASSRRVEGPGHRFAVNFNEIEKTTDEPVQTVHDELQEIPFLLTIDHGPWTIAEEEREAESESEVEDKVEVEEDEIVRHPEQANELSDIEESSRRVEGPEPNPQSPIPNPSEKIDFIHWLEMLQPVKEAKVKVEVEVEQGSTVESQQSTEELVTKKANGLQPAANSLQPTAYSLQPDPNALIDKFIETNPSVSRVKERFYDPAVQARESERLDDNLITETLARIFVKQEKYERAIDAYRKLQLKYPEKSDYFAALILEINSKIN